MIKVSVIIPVYNAEKYLRECLDSVINQSLQDIEIICVDDGSTDNSLMILREYAAKEARLKIVAQANQGAAVARNVGMAMAQGEYLTFLDADDLYCPDALQLAYNRTISVNADMVVFEADFFDDKQGLLRTESVATKYLNDLQEFSAYAISDFIFQISSCNTWNKLYKREFVQKIGLQYQELKTANDLCFVYSALACAGKIAVLDKPLVKHRVLYGGNLQSVKVKSPLDFLLALEHLKQNLRQFGLWENLKRSYLNCVMFHCLYNWQTLDKPGRKQIVAKSREITELLELAKHSADYYYSYNDYLLMCRVVEFNREGDLTIMGKLKNMLKHILPPPVNAFNREVAGIKQMMLELNAGLNAQQKQFGESYNKQFANLARQYNEQVAILQNNNLKLLELLNKQQNEVAEIEKRQQQIQECLQELDKLGDLQNDVAVAKKDILSSQSEYSTILQKEIKQQMDNSTSLINNISKDLQHIDIANNNLKELAVQNNQSAVESNKNALETLWAEIFNNTIANSQWLVNKTFSPGRWAVGYPYLYVMYRVLNEARPRKILELGLGQSTRMIGQYAAAYENIEHIVVEHDSEWIAFFENDFQLPEHSRIVQLEREMVAYKEAEAVRVFKGFGEQFVGQKFDFISIDAPLGGDMKQYARIDVLTMLPECLSDDFVIMIDDCERVGETNTLAEMEKVLKKNDISYKRGRYSGKKDCVLICAAHLGFLTSM